MSKTSLVLTILGKDRPGLVEAIAQTVAQHEGNWIESSMAHLAGQFAGILRVEVDAGAAESLQAALGSLADGGLQAAVQTDATPVAKNSPAIQLSLVGQDRPGIVREISSILAREGVNVEQLSTECVSAPHSGEMLFQAEAQLHLPQGLTPGALRSALESVASDLMVDITLE